MIRSLVPVDVVVWGRVYAVERPTLRQALTILIAAESPGDETAWQEVCKVMGKWLPLRLSSLLKAAGPEEAIPSLLKLMAVGMPEAQQRDAERAKQKAREASWKEIIADYGTCYDKPPLDVLDEPWPFFVAMHAEMDRLRAREQLRQWEAAAGAQTGKIDSMLERAGYEKPVPETPESMNDEWFERQMASAKAWRERNKRAEA